MNNNTQIDEIRNKANIVEIISKYVDLLKKGKNYFGICPFHSDTNPSMSVSPDKQIYRCFVCGNSGNVFNFLMNYKNINFMESVSEVGETVGINVGYKTTVKENKKSKPEYQSYDLLTRFYSNILYSEYGKKAYDYLIKRGITDEIIKHFKIGLTKDEYDVATRLLISKGFKENKLIELGITNKNSYGYNDVFINRIVFPLFDLEGNAVGFSGRIYNNEDTSKYVNTKETELFKKGQLLYNYHNAKKEVLKTKSIIIMEGFMDVIAAYKIGIENCVATMGTSVTDNQLDLLKKLSNNIIICFDGDKAGLDSTYKLAKMLYENNIKPKIVKLDKGLDPDEYIDQFGKHNFKIKIDNPISFLEFKLEYYKKDKNLNDSEDLVSYIDDIIMELATIEDEILIDLTLEKISTDIKISKQQLLSKFKNKSTIIKREVENKPIITDKKLANKYIVAANNLLFYMFKYKNILDLFYESDIYMPSKELRILTEELRAFYKKNEKVDVASLITNFKNTELINLTTKISELDLSNEYNINLINDYIKVIKEFNINKKINSLKIRQEKTFDTFEKEEILKEIMNLYKEIK
ncbi:MAG: DNA primase [Bacilli bacterium]